MRHADRRKFDMLARIRNFGVAHRGLFPDTSTVHPAFDVVIAEVAQLEALDVAERQASNSARAARKDVARRALLDTLTRAKTTARVLAKTIPALEEHLELPGAVDDRRLLTVARQFADAAAPHAGLFSAYGIAIEAIGELSQALDTALSERGLRRGEQVRARARIESSLARAMEALATLDVAVPNHLASDAAMLAAWKRERRVHKPKRSRAVDEADAPAVEGETATEPGAEKAA